MEVKLLSTGYCIANERISLSNGRYRSIKFEATYALLKHPTIGYILFDTGYTTRFYEATQKLPESLYRYMTPVFTSEAQHAINKLNSLGISHHEIKYIIISHFHADHIGGLKDFPNAEFICFKSAYVQIQTFSRWKAVKKGLLKDLLPADIGNRMLFVDDMTMKKDKIFGESFDLFGDGTLIGFHLPGHARGQLGILVDTAFKKTFLIADAAWHQEAITQNSLPSGIIRIFIDSWKDYVDTLRKIQKYHHENPDTVIIPCHCPQMFSRFIKE